MSRLAHTLALDVRLQWRNRLYYVGAGVVLLMVYLLRAFFTHDQMAVALPAFLFFAVGGTVWFYLGGMVLLEKGEGTLDPLTVTPLRAHEYLGSKFATLTALCCFESAVVVLLAYGLDFSVPLALAGVVGMSLVMVSIGFALAARCAGITEFLMPSMLAMIVLETPALHYFDLWAIPIWYAVPTMPPLILLEAAFRPVATGELVYGLLATPVMLAGGFAMAGIAHRRYIVEKRRGA